MGLAEAVIEKLVMSLQKAEEQEEEEEEGLAPKF